MGSQYRFTVHTNAKAYTTMTWMDIKKGFVVVGECTELTLTKLVLENNINLILMGIKSAFLNSSVGLQGRRLISIHARIKSAFLNSSVDKGHRARATEFTID